MKRRIIFLGPPGSGKGTVAERLQSDLGLPHVSSGHWLRREAENGTEIGQQARQFLDKGELVPDETVVKLMGRWVDSAPLETGFVLDGFPRNATQAQILDDWLGDRKAPIDAVVFFDAGEQAMIERITGRWTCSRCGRVYHVRNVPPRRSGVCDHCSAALVQRADDREDVVRKRFEIYRRETEPLVNYYRLQGKLIVVDAEAPVATRFAATLAALGA